MLVAVVVVVVDRSFRFFSFVLSTFTLFHYFQTDLLYADRTPFFCFFFAGFFFVCRRNTKANKRTRVLYMRQKTEMHENGEENKKKKKKKTTKLLECVHTIAL